MGNWDNIENQRVLWSRNRYPLSRGQPSYNWGRFCHLLRVRFAGGNRIGKMMNTGVLCGWGK